MLDAFTAFGDARRVIGGRMLPIRGLIVDDDANIRLPMMKLCVLPARSGIVIEWSGAANEREAYDELEKNPQVVIVDLCLGTEPGNRDGMAVVYAAKQRTNHVWLLTGQPLDQDLQLELLDLDVRWFTKPVEPRKLAVAVLGEALCKPRLVAPTVTGFDHAGGILKRLATSNSSLDVVVELATGAAVGLTLGEHTGNKTHAARALGVDRRWLQRHVPPDLERYVRPPRKPDE